MKKGIELTTLASLNGLILLICLIALNIHKFYPNTVIKAHIINTCTSYEAAINQAVKDIDCGKKYILLRGMLEMNKAEQQHMMEQEKEFGFKFFSFGCMGGDRYTQVYDQIMRRTINEIAHKSVFWTVDKYTWEAVPKGRKY
jgi:hypothetical protein